MERTSTQCRYFVHGSCSRGTGCEFAHNLRSKPDNVCKYYKSGSCSYGQKCRYDHIRITTAPRSAVCLPINAKQASVPQTLHKPTKPLSQREDWVMASEFVPGQRSHGPSLNNNVEQASASLTYAQVGAIGCESTSIGREDYTEGLLSYEGNAKELLCPFAVFRECPFGEGCVYLHGDLCEQCGHHALHPNDIHQRKEHAVECLKMHERNMEHSFNLQRSEGVACSICLDIVLEKQDISHRMFGILEGCSHPFCLECIRNWRNSTQQEKTVVRSCPVCRENSWFVTPSSYWVEENEDKSKLVREYQSYLRERPCRMFKQGEGTCSFGNSCFYKHALPDGSLVTTQPDLRFRSDAEGSFSVAKNNRLWDFIEVRDTDG